MIKGIFYIGIANILMLSANIITNFLFPKYLSTESYAMLKLFSLYTTYMGALHFGFVDGVYINYGGKKLESIALNSLAVNIATFRNFQLLVVTLLGAFLWRIQDKVLFAFLLIILPRNMLTLFKTMFQVTENYNKYSNIINISTILGFSINVILLFVLRTDSYVIFLGGTILTDIIVWIILEIYIYKYIGKFKILKFDIKILYQNIKEGFLIMLGNFASILLVGMDRVFIKVYMQISDFAEYSFAASIENMLTVFMLPFTIIFYNYLCINKSNKNIQLVKNNLLFMGALFMGIIFPLKIIIEKVVPSYINSTNVLILLIEAQYFAIILKGLYVNLYKIKKMQKKYFFKLAGIICISFVLNILFFSILKSKEAFAIGTLIAMTFWLFLSKCDFPETKFSKREIVYFILANVTFLTCNLLDNGILGGVMYFSIIVIISIVFMKKWIIQSIKIIRSKPIKI